MVIRRWSELWYVTEKISSCSLSVMCAIGLYRLESPLGLTVHIVSRLSQQIEVMCSNFLLINAIDQVKIEVFWLAIDVCYRDIIVLIEIFLCLTCFCREQCECYNLNIMWWSVCNICATCLLQVNATGLRLFHYYIITFMSTCDAWSLMYFIH
jgi:hypothetical protein